MTRGRFHSVIVAGVSAHSVVGIGPFSSVRRDVARDKSILLLFSVTISISLPLPLDHVVLENKTYAIRICLQ